MRAGTNEGTKTMTLKPSPRCPRRPVFAADLVSFDASISTDPIGGSAQYREYNVPVLFRAGNYPDKRFEISGRELADAVSQFSSVSLDLEHRNSVLDGRLGKLVGLSMNPDGQTVSGLVRIPSWLDNVLTKRSLSIQFDRATKRVKGCALAVDPRIAEANFSKTKSTNQRKVYFMNDKAVLGATPMGAMPLSGAPLQGPALWDWCYTRLKAASDASANKGFLSKSYIKTLAAAMKIVVNNGATKQGESDAGDRGPFASTDRVAYSGGMTPERRRQLLGLTHAGRETLKKQGVVSFATGADNSAISPMDSGLQGKVLWQCLWDQLSKSQDAVEDDGGVFDASYANDIADFMEFCRENGAEDTTEDDDAAMSRCQRALDKNRDSYKRRGGRPSGVVNFANHTSSSQSARSVEQIGVGPDGRPSGNYQANSGLARADGGRAAATQTQSQATAPDPGAPQVESQAYSENGPPPSMTEARRRQLLGMTATGQAVLDDKKLPTTPRRLPGLGNADCMTC
jgi:hypothetical protein